MTEWEYLKIDLNQRGPREDEVDLLNRAGAKDGSSSASARRTSPYLKRCVEDDRRRRRDQRTAARTNGQEVREQPSPVHEVAIKFRDPATGDTWTGRGRMARWLKVKEDAGEDVKKYRVVAHLCLKRFRVSAD